MRSFARLPLLAAWLPGCLAAWLSLAPELPAQGNTYVVDGSGVISGSYPSITALLAAVALQPNDVVRIQGLLGVEACRYATSGLTPGFQVHTEADVSSAFIGPINWTSLLASQFYLANTGPNSARDYTDFARTGVLTDRDIGAYQKNPR